MSSKGFTLIELLVVVAIIGILAAVGVVVYNGYTASAKVSTTKANFNVVKNYMMSELMKCQLGESNIMERDDGSKLSCSTIGGSNPHGNIISHVQNFFHHDKKFKSIYTNLSYVRNTGASTNSSSIGSIHLNGLPHDKTYNPGATPILDHNDIRLTSCFKEPCSDLNNNLSFVVVID